MNRIKDYLLLKILPVLIRRLYLLCFGFVSERFLKSIYSSLQNVDFSAWNRVLYKTFEKEIVHYVGDLDKSFLKNEIDIFNYPELVKYNDEFYEIVNNIDYAPGGMFNTELLSLYCSLRFFKPELHIESGTKNGHSAYFSAMALEKNKEEGSNCSMICVSLFSGNEKDNAERKLEAFPFVKIIEGKSEEKFVEILAEHNKSYSVLIDGPKPRQESWDILLRILSKNRERLCFVGFDSCQDHLPYWNNSISYPFGRGVNIERIKVLEKYNSFFKDFGFSLCIQSNEYILKNFSLNDSLLNLRNKSWGVGNEYSLYNFDRVKNHVSPTYKFGMIYKESMVKNEG